MSGNSKELITNYVAETGMAGQGEDSFTVWRWQGHTLHSALSLNGPWGLPLSSTTHHHSLRITGSYYPNLNTCITCGQTASTVITYRNGHWSASNARFFREILHGIPQAPPPKPQPSVTFGTGFDDATFTLTGVHSTFPAGTEVYWLLNDPSAFNTTHITLQLYTQDGITERLLGSSTVPTNPADGGEEDTLSNSPYFTAGVYQLVFIIDNHVLASGTFTIG